MFANILKRMKVVELGDADLRQPISVTDRGELATVGNLIAEKAPPEFAICLAAQLPTSART